MRHRVYSLFKIPTYTNSFLISFQHGYYRGGPIGILDWLDWLQCTLIHQALQFCPYFITKGIRN